jgi:periplasmic copper chaperone A
MRLRFPTFLAALLLLSTAAGGAGGTEIQIFDAWARPTPPGAQVGAVYFAVKNRGGQDDQLLSVASAVAASVQIHETQTVKGVMQMRPVTSVNCPAGSTVTVAPGGLHVMLLGLKQPLAAGSRFDLALRFRNAGSLTLQVPVQNGPTGAGKDQ